jgi:DNA-binding Xre family transcriptional regulator
MSALKLKEIMNDRGIGNKELAEQSGVPLGTLNKILYGDTPNPGLETMRALAAVLDCTLDDFIERPGRSSYVGSLDQETLDYLDELKNTPGMRTLFSAAKGVPKEDLELVAEMIKRMKKDSGFDGFDD